jgi:tetratricopeptide (TPR) repeat protein
MERTIQTRLLAARSLMVGVALCAGWTIGSTSGCSTHRPLPQVKRDAEQAFNVGNWQRAEADFGEYLNRRPFDNDVRYKLGLSQIQTGNPKAAAANLREALDVDPLNDKIADAQAEALLATGDKEALTAYVNRLASERGRVTDYLRVARATQAIGHADEAQTALRTAAKIDGGKSVDVQLSLASFYDQFGDKARAARRLRMAYFLAPENPEVVKRIRALGEIPGPTFALVPEEMQDDVPTLAPQGVLGTQPR